MCLYDFIDKILKYHSENSLIVEKIHKYLDNSAIQ